MSYLNQLEEGRLGLIDRTWESVREQNSLQRKHPGEVRGLREFIHSVQVLGLHTGVGLSSVWIQKTLYDFGFIGNKDNPSRKRARSDNSISSSSKRRKVTEKIVRRLLPDPRHKRWHGGARKVLGVDAGIRNRRVGRKSLVSVTRKRKRLRRLLRGWLGRLSRFSAKSGPSTGTLSTGHRRYNFRQPKMK